MSKMNERILVVDRVNLFEGESLLFQGIENGQIMVNHLMSKFQNYKEVRRGVAESNDAWKQPIPYAIIKRGDEVFLYRRLKESGEARLHDQLSIGVGGHMNRVLDLEDWEDILLYNMNRELKEELHLTIEDEPELQILGLINDDSNEVGAVHIGILAILNLSENDDVTVRETDKLDGNWVRIQDLKKTPLFESLETWSQMAVEVL